jgi:hypothetical protein
MPSFQQELLIQEIRQWIIKAVDDFFIGFMLVLVCVFIALLIPIGLIDSLISGERVKGRNDFLR